MTQPLTDEILQVRWALLDPAHDEAVTTRVLDRIEATVKVMQADKKALLKQTKDYDSKLRFKDVSVKQWEEQYNQMAKINMELYTQSMEARYLKDNLLYGQGLTWQERMTSW